jgi:ABC-type multidrug transport system fused ATPase/permease subunit
LKGAIKVDNLHVRYASDLNPVLKGISFTVKPQEKIGIVGRTGSGKSTLALSFFRFVEAFQGSITIDGIDISEIGTQDLRSNLTIVPQGKDIYCSYRYICDLFVYFIRPSLVFWHSTRQHGSV